MAHKHSSPRPPPEFRHGSQIPMPAGEDVAQPLVALLSASWQAPRQMERRDPRLPQRVMRMRQRLLTLPVRVAIVVRLVWRRMPAVTEVPRVLAREGVWWVTPVRIRLPALTNRLDVLPAAVMGQLLAEVCARLRAQGPPTLPHPPGVPVRAAFALIAMVDGSTREARRNKTQLMRSSRLIRLNNHA